MLEEMTCLLRFPGWTRCGFLWTTHVLGRGGFPSVGCNFCTGITKGEVHAAEVCTSLLAFLAVYTWASTKENAGMHAN